jgi:hypothetical protein
LCSLSLSLPPTKQTTPREEEKQQQQKMGEYFWQKIGMMMAILVSAVVMGFLPLALKKVNPALKRRLLSFGNCFAGGVFFAIGYVFVLYFFFSFFIYVR